MLLIIPDLEDVQNSGVGGVGELKERRFALRGRNLSYGAKRNVASHGAQNEGLMGR